MGALEKLRNEAEHELAAGFSARESSPAQRAAFARFEEMGLPHRRLEAWRYTDLRTRLRVAAPLAGEPEATARAAFLASIETGAIMVGFLDGRHVAEATGPLPKGVTIRAGGSFVWPITAHGDAVVALNDALADAVEIDIAAGVTLEAPIHIVSQVTQGVTNAQRVLVRFGSQSRATIVETHGGAAAHQKNAALVFEIGDGAKVEHVARHIDENDGAFVLSSFAATLGAHCELDSFALVSAGALTRRQLFVRFGGDHSRIALRGAALLKDNEHADTTLVIDHAALHCESRERFKTIVDDEGTGVYQGKVIVRAGAQKTDGAMKSDAILLSEEARMFNRPELEIFADDVVCGHGATVGALDEDQLFYLRARGLPKIEAEKLLLEAFAGEVIDEVSSEAMRDALHEAVQAWLRRRA